jgi:hypothetical protein
MASRHWLAVFSPATWSSFVAMEDPQLGFGELSGKKLKSVRIGDVFIAYVSSVKKITGIYKVAGEYNRNGVKTWKSAKFPFCLPVAPVCQFDLDKAPLFLDLAETQSWYRRLPNKKYWSFVFRNPPKILKDNDGAALVEAIMVRASIA